MSAFLEARALSRHFALPRRRPFARPQVLRAVDGVDLRIDPGEAVGLVGESGCGKSTLARLLARLLDPTAGELWLEGVRISDRPAACFARSPARRAIQMAFQDAGESLNPRATAFALIADPIRMLDPPADRAALRARVLAAAAAMDLAPELLDRLPHQLSRGQQARVGLARALAVGPGLLVLDEPTSALDVSVQARVLQRLDRLRRERGLALLFISHDLAVVRLLCDRILVMHAGRIVESGPTRAVCERPAHPCTRALLAAIPGAPPPPPPIREGGPQGPADPPPERPGFAPRHPRG